MEEMTQFRFAGDRCERCGESIEFEGAGLPVCSRECKGRVLMGAGAVI